MKKMKSFTLLVLALTMILSAFTIGAGASSAYQTYTYSIGGAALYSPDAYVASKSVNAAEIGVKDLNNATDMVCDAEGKVYIANQGNNEVLILDRQYKLEYSISTFINDKGIPDALSGPVGVFVTSGDPNAIDEDDRNGELWVCDTGKARLVVFDRVTREFKRIVDKPSSQFFDSTRPYSPSAMAVDQYGRIYVVAPEYHEGIIVMDPQGVFVGFIGGQAVTVSAWQVLWRKIQSDAQKEDASKDVEKVPYNNIAITSEGFIYATTDPDEKSVANAIKGKEKKGTYMPVKLLNPSGEEIMRRNGFWPPAGEIDFSEIESDAMSGVSKISDVAVGPENTWSIIDKNRQKIYTYDFNGNLLFAFGDQGTMLGNLAGIKAICYQDDIMLVLDSINKAIVVYERTKYGDLLISAIAAENDLDYNYAIDCWKSVLQSNNNFDAAYVGIGNAMYRSGQYEESLAYFEAAYDTQNWSNSYKEVRKEWMSDWILLILVVIIAAIVLVVKFFGFAAKVNKRVAVDGRARKSFGEELLYGFYIIFHPFDGFYDLKHEHRGSVRAALVFLGVTILTFFYQSVGQGYVLNPTRRSSTIFGQIISVLVPIFLFVLANWCLTTLFEGEGSFKDIFVASCYCLVPLPILIIPATIASNWVTTTEASLVTFVGTIAFIWVGLLLIAGMAVTHDYPMFKNIITILGTIIAMACIIFIALLFSMLLSKLLSLVTNIVTEIQYRA